MGVTMRILDMFTRSAIRILLRKSEINYVDPVAGRRPRGRVYVRAHEEVGRLNIAVDPVARMNELNE